LSAVGGLEQRVVRIVGAVGPGVRTTRLLVQTLEGNFSAYFVVSGAKPCGVEGFCSTKASIIARTSGRYTGAGLCVSGCKVRGAAARCAARGGCFGAGGLDILDDCLNECVGFECYIFRVPRRAGKVYIAHSCANSSCGARSDVVMMPPNSAWSNGVRQQVFKNARVVLASLGLLCGDAA